MGRPAKPTAIHELQGSYEKNPQRRREGEPRPKRALGPYPNDKPTTPEQCWDYLVDCLPAGVAGDYDRPSMQIAADLLAKHNTDDITSSERGQLIKMLSLFGMSPVDRTKLAVPGKKKDDEWDGF